MRKRFIGTWLLTICFGFVLISPSETAPAPTDNSEPRKATALEEVVRDREEIKRAIRSGRLDDTPGGRAYAFDAGIPVADGWLFVTGGSFALSSDDIVVFALYHPEKEILRILHAQFTGTVESGLFLIDHDGRGIIISQECLGNDPPRRFIISRGIPREDAAFRDAFAAAFRGLASRLELSPTGWHYARTLSFNSSDRAPQLDLTIHPMADAPQAGEHAVSMIYRDGRVIVMPLVSRIGSKVMRP